MRARITGVGAVSALGIGVDALWSGTLAGRVALAPASYGDIDVFEGRAPVEAAPGERAFTLADLAVDEALGGVAPAPDTALVVATTKAGIERAQDYVRGAAPAESLRDWPLHALAARIARRHGLRGVVETVSVACASGTAALGHGGRLVESGRAPRALVLGVDALCDFIVRGFASLRALGSGPAQPFDAERSGLSAGEGAAAMLLEPGPGPARAVLVGSGGSNDANHITGPSRDGSGLALAIARALEDAGLQPVDVDIVSAHGTGTRYNDAMEAKALASVFGAPPPVHGLKGAIGHSMGAAGVLEAAVCVRALEEGVCPPTAGLGALDPEISLDVVLEPRHLDLRCALSTSSGFSGVNAAVVLCRR